jgi:hypothetical protein
MPQQRTFVFVAANPGHPLKMRQGQGPSAEEVFWRHARIRRPPGDPARESAGLLDFCTRNYLHQDVPDGATYAGVQLREFHFHRRTLALARACMALAGSSPDGD